MPSSGTYAYAPDNGDFVEEAFERCGIDPATLNARHFESAMRSSNLLFSRWANLGVRLFAVDEQTQVVTQGLATYSVPSGTLSMLVCAITRNAIQTPVERIALQDYERIVDRTQQGLPTQVWHNRATGIYALWQVPENSTDTFRYFRARRIQDTVSGMDTPDLPHRWFEALAAGLAEPLALKFAPDRFDKLAALASARFLEAKSEDREKVDSSFDIGLGR